MQRFGKNTHHPPTKTNWFEYGTQVFAIGLALVYAGANATLSPPEGANRSNPAQNIENGVQVAYWSLERERAMPRPFSDYDTIITGNPQKIFFEDFTDGAFDNENATNNGPRPNNWRIFGGTVGFNPPNDRPDVPLALSRRIAANGAAWEGAQYMWLQDLNGDGVFTTDEKKKWYVDKKDEVVFTRFRSFSDLAFKPETYGVEVAFLEDNDDYIPPPDYGHDLSWEVLHANTVDRSQQAMQLEGNAENLNNRSPLGVRQAHFTNNGGYPTSENLNREYTSLCLWRNRPGERKTNIESWGEANVGDYEVGAELNSQAEPMHKYSIFNNVQITLFRGGLPTSNRPEPLYRSGVQNTDAQVGILWCEVGITKKSDFNLDFKVDETDANTLAQNIGRTDSTTIRQGDANNDSKIDLNDALPVAAFYDRTGQTPFDSVYAYATYNPATGEIIATLKNISFVKITSQSNSLTGSSPWASTGALLSAHADSASGAFTINSWDVQNLSLGNLAAAGLANGDLRMRVNFMGSQNSEGYEVVFNTAGFVSQALREDLLPFRFDGQWFRVPKTTQPLTIQVFALTGQRLFQQDINGAQLATNNWRESAGINNGHLGPKILFIQSADRKRTFLRQQYINR